MTYIFDMVSEIESYAEELSNWELEFVDSISHKLGNDRHLSRKEKEVLKQLHEDKVK